MPKCLVSEGTKQKSEAREKERERERKNVREAEGW